MKLLFYILAVAGFLWFENGEVLAQTQQESSQAGGAGADTAKDEFAKMVEQIAQDASVSSVQAYEAGKVAIHQDEIVEQYLTISNKVKAYLKSGIDTTNIHDEIQRINDRFDIVKDGVFTNKGTSQTSRNLATSSILISELLRRAQDIKSRVDKYQLDLSNYKSRLDSLNADPVLYKFPKDSASIMRYLKRLNSMASNTVAVDTALKYSLEGIKEVQLSVNNTVNLLVTANEDIIGYQKELAGEAFQHEFSNLWDKVGFKRPFSEIIHFSKIKGQLALKYYVTNHSGRIFLFLLLLVGAVFFLQSLRQNLNEEMMLRPDFKGQLVLRHPVLSAIVIVFSLFQFIFPNPPFVFSALLWLVSAISLTYIFRGYITMYWMYSWLALVGLFILACLLNCILQASRTERWLMMGLSALALLTCSFILLRGHRSELRERSIVYFIGLVIFLVVFSMIANAFGRYNLAKTVLTSGCFSVIIAILFLWTVRFIEQALELSSMVYKKPEGKAFYINFEKVGTKVPSIFYVLLVVGWFYLFGRNYYSFNLITGPIEDFLTKDRVMGDFTFNISSLLIFFGIIIISALISQLVSFFASDAPAPVPGSDKKARAGFSSWLLIIRIMILSIGLFLAFAAAGIPMDRLSIIIGALGVGIGFGLNELINNLVSGLIISFEKPINVGDVVEVGDQSGTIKSIGFRSSILTTFDGAEVIVPNGHLLSERLINWTLSNGRRRGELLIGVAYGTDLTLAKQILLDILTGDDRILKHPEPKVFAVEFNSSSIDFKIYFWIRHVSEYVGVKSDIISSIDVAFKTHKIEIPFPQQDVHVHQAKGDVVDGDKS